MSKWLIALLALGSTLVWARGAVGLDGQVPPSLVFERNGDLYRMTLDGSETVRLTTTKAIERGPAVSPDRLRIAYGRDSEVWLMSANGTGASRLVAAPRGPYSSSFGPAWSPDGRTVFFVRQAQTDEICSSIFRVGAEGGGLRPVTRGLQESSMESEPAVSPDGRRIALVVGECEPGLDCCYLGVVDLKGRPTKDLRKLPPTPGAQFSPTWAPDGRRIAFVVENLDTEVSAVYVANRDGSGLRRVTERRLGGRGPAWSPDGEWIAFTGGSHDDLFVIRPDGTGLRRLARTRASESEPAWLLRT